jgi:hypothetical protein
MKDETIVGETPIEDTGDINNSLGGLVNEVLTGVQFKSIILLFMIFLFIVSDVFTINVLQRFNGAVDYKTPTSFGSVIQGTCLVLLFIFADLLVRRGLF